MSACRSCGAPIVWAKTPKGKMMPVDKEPSERGTVRLVPNDRKELSAYTYGSIEALQMRSRGVELHAAHFATCTSPSSHRRP